MFCPVNNYGFRCDCHLWRELTCDLGAPVTSPLDEVNSLLCQGDDQNIACDGLFS